MIEISQLKSNAGRPVDEELVSRLVLQGWDEPIIVSKDHVVLSGEHRVEAARRLGLTQIEGRIV